MKLLGFTSFIVSATLFNLVGFPAKADSLNLDERPQESFLVETIEIPYEEASLSEGPFDRAWEHEKQTDILEDAPSGGTLPLGELINGFADLLKKVLAPDTPLLKGSVIAEARPEGFTSMQLQNSRSGGRAFKKPSRASWVLSLSKLSTKSVTPTEPMPTEKELSYPTFCSHH